MREGKRACLPNVTWNEIVVNWKQIEVRGDKVWVGVEKSQQKAMKSKEIEMGN